MRSLLAAVLVVVISACDSKDGGAGPQGPQGVPGQDGVTGAVGPTGPTGPAGPQGPKGDPGQVLVLDGGAIQGPAGPSGPAGATGASGPGVTTSVLSMLSPTCPTGGVRVTQRSDGGIVDVCNGAVGPAGPPGAIGPTGATGALGPVGPQGMTGSIGPMGPVGSIGPTGATGAIGPAGPQGIPGSTGATGPAGSAGLAGPQGTIGPQGPAGPPGAVMLVDGGVVLAQNWHIFAGYSPGTYTGNLGGRVGAHAICDTAFSGAHFCDENEYVLSRSGASVPASGAWIDNWDDSQPGARSINTTCNHWTTGTTAYEGIVVRSDGTFTGTYVSSSDYGCGQTRPVACCFASRKSTFRGFTPQVLSGNLGGRVGAHATCASAFAGSHFCDEQEYVGSFSGTAIPASGAWVDNWDPSQPGERSINTTCNRWTTGTTSYEGLMVRNDGTFGGTYVSSADYGCGQIKPLACCQ